MNKYKISDRFPNKLDNSNTSKFRKLIFSLCKKAMIKLKCVSLIFDLQNFIYFY